MLSRPRHQICVTTLRDHDAGTDVDGVMRMLGFGAITAVAVSDQGGEQRVTGIDGDGSLYFIDAQIGAGG